MTSLKTEVCEALYSSGDALHIENWGCAVRKWFTEVRESASATGLNSPFTCRMLSVNWEM